MAPMKASRWRGELNAAATDKDVLNVARDYVAFLAGDELLSLPNDLKPGQLGSCEEISTWALTLVQASLTMNPAIAGTGLLREMSEFFAAASARLSELQAKRRD
jgi:hypothetical protein